MTWNQIQQDDFTRSLGEAMTKHGVKGMQANGDQIEFFTFGGEVILRVHKLGFLIPKEPPMIRPEPIVAVPMADPDFPSDKLFKDEES